MKLSFIASVVASCNTNKFFFRHQDFQSAEREKKAKIKCLLISPKLQKLLVIRYLNLLGDMPNRIQLPLMKFISSIKSYLLFNIIHHLICITFPDEQFTNECNRKKWKDEKLINDIIHHLICLTFPDERFTNECNRKKWKDEKLTNEIKLKGSYGPTYTLLTFICNWVLILCIGRLYGSYRHTLLSHTISPDDIISCIIFHSYLNT
jgi:hypothetical protein